MEKELNIAAILMEKPTEEIKKMKFWSSIFGEVYLTKIDYLTGMSVLHHDCQSLIPANGKMWEDGECVFFPSKQMRDWEKFAWKKGDVLKSGVDNLCIFEEWDNDSYTEFNANFITDRYNGGVLETKDWSKETDENIIKQYIAKIEEIKGGKLNLETLEIEKPEFKDGDIVTIHKRDIDIVFILSRWKTEDSFYYYAFHTCDTDNTGIIDERITLPYEWTYVNGKLKQATDSEKQQLFNALAKEGKRWNSETKQIEDLPKKCEFKAFDKVLSRGCSEDYWVLNFYSHKTDYYHICIDGSSNLYCVPYNDQTAHLLGTTNEWEGGEG